MGRALAILTALLFATSASAETTQVLNPPLIPVNVTVAQLPTCNSTTLGQVFRVTDSLVPALGGVVAGGGAVAVIVRCNGTSFLVGQ